jgi:hypothetical protein
MTDDGKAKALQAIGAYMCAYSDATYELGEVVKALFKLEDNAMSEAIVAALGDFARQASLARALCQLARNADGTELSEKQKKQIDKTITGCFECNGDRKMLAHGRLEPHADGSVAIVHIKIDKKEVKGKEPVIWSPGDWTSKTARLVKLADELRSFHEGVKTIAIDTPTGSTLGWLTSQFVEPLPLRIGQGDLSVFGPPFGK